MTERITLTTDAAAMFLSWLETDDQALLRKLMDHPGYMAVADHSRTWGSEVTSSAIIDAVAGRPSLMYGLGSVRENASAVAGAIAHVESHRNGIVDLVYNSLARLFPEDLAYPVGLHCIVGYDWGIGLHGSVAINLNSRLYLDDLREIGYMLIHEATHVAYERAHGPMGPGEMREPGGLCRLVYTLVQNEGLAVYSALRARVEGNCLENKDYRFLLDPASLAEKTATLKALLRELTDEYPGDEAVGSIFDRLSRDRLSYVVGCSAFMNLEKQGGLAVVREAALWTPERFVTAAVLVLP